MYCSGLNRIPPPCPKEICSSPKPWYIGSVTSFENTVFVRGKDSTTRLGQMLSSMTGISTIERKGRFGPRDTEERDDRQD